MKTPFDLLRFILFLLAVASLASCYKPHEQPQCRRVYELIDYYTPYRIKIRTDTSWPWGRDNNVFCGTDTLVFVGYVTAGMICADSTWRVVRYTMQ